jgi:hypothetical protein
MYQNMYHIMHQPCTKNCTLSCINHVPKPVPYHASTMYQNMYHIMHQPCTISCTKTCTITCASTIYHITHDMSQSCHTPCTIRYHQKVPQACDNITMTYTKPNTKIVKICSNQCTITSPRCTLSICPNLQTMPQACIKTQPLKHM